MPIYEYENTQTGERFTENLPIHKRNFPCRNSFIRRVISVPKISIISDMGGREDKAREQIMDNCKKCEHGCHCSDGGSCTSCECKDCDCQKEE